MDDILLRSELDALAVKYPDRFQLLYSVDKEPEKEDKKRGIGHFGHTDLNTLKFLFEPNPKASAKLSARKEEAIALVCGEFWRRLDRISGPYCSHVTQPTGPPAMMEKAVYPAMKQIGYNLDQNLWAF